MKSFLKKIKLYAVQTSPIWDPIYKLGYQILKLKRIKIPPLKNRHRVGSWKIGRFIESGYLGFSPINAALGRYDKDQKDIKILDFGAGVGRTLMHMNEVYKKLYAVDVDISAIKYLKKSFPSITAIHSDYSPPLLFRDNLFDAVYSVSIWTHLPLELQTPWLLEIKRILRPGGLALITTSGFKALQLRQIRDIEWQTVKESELSEKGIIYKEYSHFKPNDQNFPGIQKSYGLTAHSPEYIKKEWGKYFSVLGIQEAVIDNIQDLVILKNEKK